MKKTTRREILQIATAGVGLAFMGQSTFIEQSAFGQFDGFGRHGLPLPLSRSNPAIRHFDRNCIECGRCRIFCHEVTTVFGHLVPEGEDECIYCGQCTLFCQTEALTEQYHYPLVSKAIADSDKIVIASTSPAIRVALGEMGNLKPGTNVERQIVGALRKLGVDYVLDTTFGADLTVMEEASELLQRLDSANHIANNNANNEQKQKPLPMLTTCCPAWVRFAKLFYPKLLPNLSTAKSPILMQGAVTKTYFAQKNNLDPKKIFHVALTPCTAKKAEILLPNRNAAGVFHHFPRMRDIDVALTTRELAYLLKDAKINFAETQNAEYDSVMGKGSGAGMIFGNSGGVMEATLRTAFRLLNDKNPPQEFFEMKPVRGFKFVRETSVDLGKRKLNVAVVHGVGAARPFFEAVQDGKTNYDFIEVMACPGGCIGGGGQPFNNNMEMEQLLRLRGNALYRRDIECSTRMSCDNSEIQKIYSDFLEKPLSPISQRLLHLPKQ